MRGRTSIWRAGRAPLIIISGGGARAGRTEADMMAKAIAGLDVPASALLLETRSLSTRDNAMFTTELAEQRGIRRVLLVTSSLHMPRALLMFRETGLDVVAFPVSDRINRRTWKDRWLPTPGALWRSGRALCRSTPNRDGYSVKKLCMPGADRLHIAVAGLAVGSLNPRCPLQEGGEGNPPACRDTGSLTNP